MTNTIDYRESAIKKIEDYLKGAITDTEASDLALDVLTKAKDLEKISLSVLSAIQCLADLHDAGKSWCPSQDELRRWKAELEKES